MRFDLLYALRFFSERLLFGSDYPDYPISKACHAIERILEEAEANEETRRKLYNDNAHKLFAT